MNTKNRLMLSGATTACLFLTMPGFAQDADTPTPPPEDDAVATMDTVTVNARKREESLTDVPVSISVLSAALVEDAGVVTQGDLFQLVPGIFYNEAVDRNSALPGVRGITTTEIATNRTKVTQFIDGMPVLGSQGNAPFGQSAQVEVYRGPQSAAFGRSTFAGALNYITRDPGDEFEATANLDINDFGRVIYGATVSGPITESLGFLLNADFEDTSAPDQYIATDGTPYGERTSEAYGAKLVFSPNDDLEIDLAFSHVESDDGPTPSYFISQQARDACFTSGGSQLSVGMGTNPYYNGEYDCDWSQGAQIAAQNDRSALLIEQGVTDENILFLAESQSLPAHLVGTQNERDRLALNISYDVGDLGTLEFAGFIGEETYIRGFDGSNNAVQGIDIGLAMGVMGDPPAFPYEVNTGMGAEIGIIMSDPSDIEEEYAEIRWLSPEDQRLRYVVGASVYDYSFLTEIYFGGYGAILQGPEAVERYLTLTGDDLTIPNQVFAEEATNVGLFFNTAYDFTEKLTGTIEARYQVDTVGGRDRISGANGEIETTSFLPRVSFNYAVNDDSSFYGQIAKGNNPAGINVAFFDDNLIAQLDCLLPTDFNPDGTLSGAPGFNGETPCGQNFVSFQADTFEFFEEETLINYEIGYKGRAFDNKLTFAVAAFFIDWQDQTQTVNLDWNLPGAMGGDYTGNRSTINQGDIESMGFEFEGTYTLTDDLSVRGTFGYLDAEYTTTCDVTLIENTGFLAVLPVEDQLSAVDSGLGYDCLDVSGNVVALQPKHTASLSPTYRTPLGNSGFDLNMRGDLRYTGSQYMDTANIAKLPATTIVNVSAGLSNQNWSITGYVNNIFDDDTPLRIGGDDDFTLTGDPLGLGGEALINYLVTPRQPRTVGLRLRYTY